MKIAVINDTHFGRSNDSLIHDAYFRCFYDEIFFPALEQNKIEIVWHGGDLFDRRRFVNFNILSNAREYFIDPISSYNTFFAMGNHDIYYSENSKLNSPDLLVNFRSFEIMADANEYVFDGLKVLFIPWITNENRDRTMEMIAKTDARVAYGHLDVHGFEMDKGAINKHGLDLKIFEKFERVWSGHFHHKNGIYLGAPYQMTWADCDDPKGFHILDTATLEMKFIQNPFTLYKKWVYDDVDHLDKVLAVINENGESFRGKFVKIMIQNRTQHDLFDTIHQVISRAGVHDLSVIDKLPQFVINQNINNIEQTAELNESIGNEDTGKIISSHVETAKFPAHINRDIIRDEMSSLFVEASNIQAAL
jgi:DNA repair exonuclease SbcCD nuclease subunit